MPPSKIATQIRLDETVHSKLKHISDKELRSLNAQMEYFILKGIEAYERENSTAIFLDKAFDKQQ